MSGPGNKNLVINPQERAVSPDINRLQKFANKDYAELFRYMMDVTGNDDIDAGGVIAEPSTIESPLRAEIINGLLVRPVGGTLDVTVDPGVAYVMAPDGEPDSSNYKFVSDPGIPGAGTLAMTANASGSIRIDVIECRINPIDQIVTDTRDIFSTTNGLFTAATITKERSARLEYRVRLGTPGLGFPPNVLGWLPLAVASVPNLTATNDTITFWDVRPLLEDREFTPYGMTRNLDQVTRVHCDLKDPLLSGIVEATYKGRRIGGRLRKGTPGFVAAETIDITSLDNLDVGVYNIRSFVYLYLLFPYGLPRWARYTEGPAGRVPRSPRGIPIISPIHPKGIYGIPQLAITPPANSGLVTTTTDAYCILPIGTAGAVFPGPGYYSTNFGDGRVIWTDSQLDLAAPTLLAATATWSLDDNAVVQTHPPNARALWVRIGIAASVAATTTTDFLLNLAVLRADSSVAANLYLNSQEVTNLTGGALNRSGSWTVRIPLTNDYPNVSVGSLIHLIKATLNFNILVAQLRIIGYEISP